jgi:cytochrome c
VKPSTKLMLAVALALAATGADAQSTRQLLEKGRRILDANCSGCHAIGKDGASLHAKAPPFRTVVTRYAAETLAEALAEGIVSGHPDMPEFIFEPDEIEAIVAYLDSLAPARKP